ncbi:hypothetical protein ARALYDRAFT_351449 [Arabidopsis lyrata subsp. lyrata]|uniref:Uncharacterized protein n=1 Tax=Arabidopsis lyrata subsp. lyrata TaxID=81972 RepID=D7M321_ARALL|nr:hypothetical protein ARALYDRAFT_351449 [Arabidopsis lyrata subsp. lyrata]
MVVEVAVVVVTVMVVAAVVVVIVIVVMVTLWGKIGASLHRSHKSKAIGGIPPYLMPFFGMFGYGGPYACMHLGRRTLVSSKTKLSKKVFTLQLNREALTDNRSILGKNWKSMSLNADGGMRDPLEEEIKLSPHGSFTKVEIFESECKIPEIYQLQCRLKDIYFPYIQCDEISKTGRTERPVEFQGNSITTNKKKVVEPSSKVGSWKLASNVESARQYNVQVGSSLPPCSIACFDEYENQIAFTSVPTLEVELNASPGFQIKIDMIEGQPDYEATLEICSKDEPFSVLVACKVNPRPLKHVVEMYPESLEYLLPGSTVQNYILEVFDGYNNHVAEGTNVLICIEGYCIKDPMGFNRKVNSCGCVDLSGILQVTASYGKSISLSVMYGIDEIFKKESLIERRELMLLTKLPDCCAAGSNLTNLIFEVTDSDGAMDTSIHHDEKSGCFHTMSIESDSRSVESAIRYAFVHESCKVPTLSLPESEGVFSFRVFHSRFPELHLTLNGLSYNMIYLEIQLTPAQIFERDEIGCSTPYSRMSLTPQSKMASTTNSSVAPTEQTPCSQFRVLAIRASSSALSSQTSLLDMAQFTESLKEKLIRYSEDIVEVDERLKCLEAEQNQAKEELSTLQASLETLGATFPECLSTKESMMKQIEEKHHDTAASVFCCLYRKAPPPQSLFLSKKGVFGLVELLGSVASTSPSR